MRNLLINGKILELETARNTVLDEKAQLSEQIKEHSSDTSEDAAFEALSQEVSRLTAQEFDLTERINKLKELLSCDYKITDKLVCKSCIVQVNQNGTDKFYLLDDFTDISDSKLNMLDMESELGSSLIGLKVGDTKVIKDIKIEIKGIL